MTTRTYVHLAALALAGYCAGWLAGEGRRQAEIAAVLLFMCVVLTTWSVDRRRT